MAVGTPPEPARALSLSGLAHPGWFGGVMGTAALSRALLEAGLGRFEQIGEVLSWLLMALAAAMFVVVLAVGLLSLRRSPGTLRERIVSPVLGPVYAAVPGAVFTLILAVLGHDPDVLQRPVVRWAVLAVVVTTLLGGVWLTLTFFVAAFESEAFDARSISGTWFLPETVVLLAAVVLRALTDASDGPARTTLASATIAVAGAGFVLFLLTAALFFSRMVLERQHHEAGVAAVWIFMSPLSVSSLALGAAAAVLPSLVPLEPTTVVALVSLGSGLLWGFGLWWLAASLLLTFHHGRGALAFTPGSWSYVFPMAAISLATADLARIWGSGVVTGLGVALVALTTATWAAVAAAAGRWMLGRLRA